MNRRKFIYLAGTLMLSPVGHAQNPTKGKSRMYGLIGKMIAKPGERDALVAILLEGVSEMPGCLSYVVAHNAGDANAIWVTEVWQSKESHKASLSLPVVQNAIARGKPLIASFGESFETEPVDGFGLGRAR
jgi:quinol monooxygenase YgiN